MWNVNAVLMGGLGKDPIIAEAQGLCHDVLKNLYVFNQRERETESHITHLPLMIHYHKKFSQWPDYIRVHIRLDRDF